MLIILYFLINRIWWINFFIIIIMKIHNSYWQSFYWMITKMLMSVQNWFHIKINNNFIENDYLIVFEKNNIVIIQNTSYFDF